MEWQDIATAPKDGTQILLWYKADGHEMGFWDGRCWDDGDFYDNLGSDADFSHWMPLPPPPKP